MSTELVHYAQAGSIASITMDDGKANALSGAMLDALHTAFDRAEKEASAVVLTGREGKFCAGFDLRVMMSGPEAAIALVKAGGELLLRLYALPLPLVVGVTGHALAGGVLLAATGDTRIGIHGQFKIGLNEVQNGMPVPILAHELARDRLHAAELLASVVQAKIYDPEAAVRAGWLDRAVAPEALAAECAAEAEHLAKLPRAAYAMTKRSLRRQTIEYIRATFEANVVEMQNPTV